MALHATKEVELFKGGLSLERGDYSTYTFIEIYMFDLLYYI